ncbi:MAG: hypothetical protein NVS9B4_01380 [Candidatus Acidiferrum sp.]
MSAAPTICLKFGLEIPDVIQARIFYAFQVFAAIYNYKVADADANPAVKCFVYGGPPPNGPNPGTFYVPARYKPRAADTQLQKLVTHRYACEDHYLLHGIDEATGKPDWLGEIFEWISSSHEMSVMERDSIGRVPDSGMIFSRQGISPKKPYATLLMAWMENSFRAGDSVEALPKAPSPVPGIEHMVVCSHDVDFYYLNKSTTFIRLLKNMVIACRLYNDWSFFESNFAMLLGLLRGKRPGDYLYPLTEAIKRGGFNSTFFVVARRGHRRDPNYRIEQLATQISDGLKKGFSFAVHGSYTSIIENGNLVRETLAMEKLLRKKPLGSRQHWLRFDSHTKLFNAIEDAELAFDSTLGFADLTGFRNGASFAFPPYNFKEEKPHRFLEIPLVLMDGALEAESRVTGEAPQEIADTVLQESRKWSWGGISVLWHNPMEALQVPTKINCVFWDCAEKREQFGERWMSADTFLEHCLHRYQNVGLLEGMKFNA